MDDNEHVCPLCCEELDISDQQFFPCKCGYQVCMWCWHRIRESESGLCPACRTPYGDDPHEFSAVDVQEVLKANREKEAAAKRERDRQRQQQQQHSVDGVPSSSVAASGLGGASTHGDDGSGGGGLTGIMEVPKDRTQLANMRVIRRNLVYAVGLPPSIANEDVLRKPEYFGQYGKIAKIVLNRNQASNGDPRRASCSAYVTFVHKEDTLACILALDGFYLENRNIRASYGTSKYCSAFIKNVRCNNPECTYLHEMGAVEDTFTKQEIQAGYVTSGRDVLARQQQIVQQALSASQGAAGSTPRRRVGGGGPSGTGRSASTPVFPAPEFDEPSKPAPTLVPAPAGMSRAASTGTGFPTVAAAIHQAAATTAKPIVRSSSVGANGKANIGGTIPATTRKGILSSATSSTSAGGGADGTIAHAPQGATAASVVAGVHSVSGGLGSAPSPHTTLTPLTPLKRTPKTTTSTKPVSSVTDNSQLNMPTIGSNSNFPKPQKVAPRITTTAKTQADASRGAAGSSIAPGTPPSPGLPSVGSTLSNNSALASLSRPDQQQASSLSSLGGEVIAPPERTKKPVAVGAIGSPFSGSGAIRGNNNNAPVGPGTLNGDILGVGRPTGLSGLGGEVFNGPLTSAGPKSAIGSGKSGDKWGSSPFSGSGALNTGGVGVQPIGPPGGLWSNSGGANLPGISGPTIGAPNMGGIGGGVIGNHISNQGLSNDNTFMSGARNSGSSALASLLGIDLPTGSGSLRESTNLWPESNAQQLHSPAPVSTLQGTPMPSQGIIGRSVGSSSLIGGIPIGGNPIGMGGGMGASIVNQQGVIGSSNKNDIALLQSLLPDVHISSGSGIPQNGWNTGGQHQPPVGIGAVGRHISQQTQTQGTAGNLNIW